MTWNYRIVAVTLANSDVEYGLYEVYYDADDRPIARTEDPVGFTGDSAGEVIVSMSSASGAFYKPVLLDSEIGTCVAD